MNALRIIVCRTAAHRPAAGGDATESARVCSRCGERIVLTAEGQAVEREFGAAQVLKLCYDCARVVVKGAAISSDAPVEYRMTEAMRQRMETDEAARERFEEFQAEVDGHAHKVGAPPRVGARFTLQLDSGAARFEAIAVERNLRLFWALAARGGDERVTQMASALALHSASLLGAIGVVLRDIDAADCPTSRLGVLYWGRQDRFTDLVGEPVALVRGDVVHVARHGVALCGLRGEKDGRETRWPAGHAWIEYDDPRVIEMATCEACRTHMLVVDIEDRHVAVTSPPLERMLGERVAWAGERPDGGLVVLMENRSVISADAKGFPDAPAKFLLSIEFGELRADVELPAVVEGFRGLGCDGVENEHTLNLAGRALTGMEGNALCFDYVWLARIEPGRVVWEKVREV